MCRSHKYDKSRDEGWGEGMSRMVIDDEMWSRLESLLPKPKGPHGKDDRLFMQAICWILFTGAASSLNTCNVENEVAYD
jgi:hypothetical protein